MNMNTGTNTTITNKNSSTLLSIDHHLHNASNLKCQTTTGARKRNWIFLTMTETLSSQMHKRKHYLINLSLIQINIYFQWLIKPYSYLNIWCGRFLWLNNLFKCKDCSKMLIWHLNVVTSFAKVEDVGKLNWTRIFDLVKWLCINVSKYIWT